MKFEKEVITIDKVLNKLDKFVIGFLEVFEKHSDYVLVSGYISILLGRSRISEDVDLLFPELELEGFKKMHDDLLSSGFWCLNSNDVEELHGLLKSKHSIRYGMDKNLFPNMEIKFILKPVQKLAFKKRIQVKLPSRSLWISALDLQVAFKEEALGSDKDKEDAEHLRKVFEIDEEKVKYYKQFIKDNG